MEKYVAEIEGNQFYARDLIEALKNEGIQSAWVWQSGGGTATFVMKENDAHMPFTAGPGSYNWTDPVTSIFTTDELYFGPDYNEYVEQYDSEPEEFPIAPGTPLQAAARQIAAKYREVNP